MIRNAQTYRRSSIQRLFAVALAIVSLCALANEDYSKGMLAYQKGEFQAAFQYWQAAADSGDAKSMFNLGLLHEQQLIENPNLDQAEVWYRKASAAGYPAADFQLATMLQHQGEEQQALAALQRAAEQGYAPAQKHLAQPSHLQTFSIQKQEPIATAEAPSAISSAEQSTKHSTVVKVEQETIQGTQLESEQTQVPSQAVQINSEQSDKPSDPASQAVVVESREIKTTEAEQVVKRESVVSAHRYLDQQWLKAQKPSAWTIQLLAFTERDKVIAFIEEHKIRQHAAYFEERSQSAKLFKLTYGIYPNKNQAQSAREALPDSLKAHGPWLRRLSDIQAVLN